MLSAMAWTAVSAYALPDYSYWFDGDSIITATGTLPGNGAFSLDIDASALDGSRPHTLHFQVADTDGNRSAARSAMFLKAFSLTGSTAHIYVDGLYHSSIPTTAGNTGVRYEIDASDYDFGLHTLMVQLVTHDNILAAPVEGVFMRVPTDAEVSGYRCYYTIDNDGSMPYTGSYSNGMVHADIDAASLQTGLHSIQFMLASPDGLATQCMSAFFMKLPLGAGDIGSYDYWVNDDTQNITHVDLEKAQSPFRLMALLPVKSYPLRTSSFRFKIEDGKPVIYPLNDFNMLVSSANGQFTSVSSPFYDVTMPTAVTASTVEPTPEGAVTNVGQIPSGEIRWYEFSVKSGDSIAVSVDQPCTVDAFDKEGTTCYTATGSDAVKGGGFHAFADGKIYIALHDAKKTGAVRLTLTHIDRYALLKYTPRNMSPDGFVFFDLKGNGYENLKSVTLGSGNTSIVCDSLTVYSNTTARVCFNFYNNGRDIIGMQPLVLHFDDGTAEGTTDLSVENAVNVETPVYAPLEVKVDPHNSKFALDHPVTVTLTNPGNVGCWGIPLNVAFDGNRKDITFKDFSIITLNPVDGNEFPISFETDNLLGTGNHGTFIPIILPYIGPNESIRFTFVVKCTFGDTFNCYAWAGEPWSQEGRSLLDETGIQRAPAQTRASRFNYETFGDVQSAVGNAGTAGTAANVYLGVGTTIAGIHNGIGKWQQEEQRRCYGAAYDDIAEYLPNYDMPAGMTPTAILVNSAPMPGWMSTQLGILLGINDRQHEHAENPNPMPRGSRISIPRSYDPNDILGYRSLADTEHIGKDVTILDYTIEFENDPEFANASAQTITVIDKLDGTLFDLSTFKAGEFTLGKHAIDFEGVAHGVKTIDMRPEINGIAQVTVDFNEADGQLLLTVNSLDPITLELTDDVMQGVLPVNNDGEGIGELHYTIGLREGLADATEVDNMATIVFDENPPIDTPVWHNVTDYTLPTSEVTEVTTADNVTFAIKVNGTDTGAGIWHYDLYARWDGSSDWMSVAESLEAGDDGVLTYTAPAALKSAQFVTVAYDKAGNMEDSEMLRKQLGDVDGSGKVDANDVLLLRAYYIQRPVTLDLSVADVNSDGSVDAQDATAARVIYLASQVKRMRAPHVRTRKSTSK